MHQSHFAVCSLFAFGYFVAAMFYAVGFTLWFINCLIDSNSSGLGQTHARGNVRIKIYDINWQEKWTWVRNSSFSNEKGQKKIKVFKYRRLVY